MRLLFLLLRFRIEHDPDRAAAAFKLCLPRIHQNSELAAGEDIRALGQHNLLAGQNEGLRRHVEFAVIGRGLLRLGRQVDVIVDEDFSMLASPLVSEEPSPL